MRLTAFALAVAVLALSGAGAAAQQIGIPRINSMPDRPAPYEMRNWKEVARAYDRFVFDFGKSGTHLPLIRWRTNTVNYPGQISFGLHTYVGTYHPNSSEAINLLPALVGASLAGIDKTTRDGHNWVLMSQEYFNRRPEENVYLNHPVTSSGSDWWYDTMPNVFFYQLYDLYPGVGDSPHQLTSVADRWLEAVRHMGGSAAPWQVPWMRYRGWHLATMTPNRTGVVQPEAAGAIAWILYHAYRETGRLQYRSGAEWAMEYLNSLNSNPSYELQLSYGAYIAARMNAEIGTEYDVEKLVNWCFSVGPLRSWGAIVGNWGGYDVSGLIGEVSGNDYAFLMNTFQQAGALTPMVRYDPRFARAIGKWMLNAANAARLLYPAFLPGDHQDNFEWSQAHDPESVIAYEALRRTKDNRSPFATGDAMGGGWARTNLALYGSSHVGYLASIVDTTNVEMILQLDLLKTDFFGDEAYPSYLYYNPHEAPQEVLVDAGPQPRDLYDAVSKQFIASGVSGTVAFTVPPGDAVLLVLTPAGGDLRHDAYGRMLVNDVIVDYRAREPSAVQPRVKGVGTAPDQPVAGTEVDLHCTGAGDITEYAWTALAGELEGSGPVVKWRLPEVPGIYEATCRIRDSRGTEAEGTVPIAVVPESVPVPEITALTARPRKVHLGGQSELFCDAVDPESSAVTYTWFSTDGSVAPVNEQSTVWTAPAARGDYYVGCRARNDRGGTAADSLLMPVRDLSEPPEGSLIAFYPFDGSARDAGPYGMDAAVRGATLVEDRDGRENHAYFFNGTSASLLVDNRPELNFTEGVTVSVWFRPDVIYSREAFIISHGSWQNRWKLSMADGRLRWTINTAGGIRDLDSSERLEAGRYYHAAATYNGEDMELYVDGELDAFTGWTGALATTGFGLTIGQMLPSDDNYNFRGVIDEVRLYDYALPEGFVQGIFTPVEEDGPRYGADAAGRLHAFPNPSPSTTHLVFELSEPADVEVAVFNVLGQLVRRLGHGSKPPGRHELVWDGRDSAGVRVPPGVYHARLQAGSRLQWRPIVRL